MIVDASQDKSRNRSTAAPNTREAKQMDTMGRRQFSLAAFTLRVANYIAAMSAYQKHLWDKVLPRLQSLSETDRPIILDFHKESMLLAKQEMIATRHIVDASARQVAASVSLRRQAWLHSASISDDVRARIED